MNIHIEANKMVTPHTATFEKFRAYVAPYFELRKQDAAARVKALLEGVEFRSRPVIALRLYDKWDKIVIRPDWTSERKDKREERRLSNWRQSEPPGNDPGVI